MMRIKTKVECKWSDEVWEFLNNSVNSFIATHKMQWQRNAINNRKKCIGYLGIKTNMYSQQKIKYRTTLKSTTPFNSVQFSCSVVSDSLWPRKRQHARTPCPSPVPRVHPNSCPLSQWCHPTLSSSVILFSSCPQSLPASGSFPMSQLFESGGQSIGVSASTSVLPMNMQDWSALRWTGWISLQSKGLSRVFSNTAVQKHQFFDTQLSL